MTRRNRNGFSTEVSGSEQGFRRVLIAGFAIIAALMLILTLAVRPTAYANNEQATKITSGQQVMNALAPGQVGGEGSATVLVYLNGSDLESDAGEATSDISEMLDSGIGDNANVVIQTLGTREWQDYGIASDHTQRYAVEKGELELVDDSLGQLDTTDPDTLADFISWGVQNYPADRYILVLWDHGAGPVYGFGYDEFQSEESALTIDEMKQALEANPDVHFDIIGMDCCIMGSLETCFALQQYCDYMVVSEDFEPGIGWSYKGWMGMLEQNPNVDTAELGTVIVDDMIGDIAADEENGEATLALIDESKVNGLYEAWVNFAYANKDTLLGTNYSQETEWRDRPNTINANERAHGEEEWDYGWDGWEYGWEEWDYDGSYVTMTDYFITDINDVASSIEGAEADALRSAYENALVHYSRTAGETSMGGLGVTLPYGDGEFYDQLVQVFKASGIDSDYIDWLEDFVDAEGLNNDYYAGDEGYGYENGFDNGYGYGNGSDCGYSCDNGYDYDNGYGYDSGYGYGYGYGNGSGYGYGYDDWYGYGNNSYGGHHHYVF